MNFAFEMIEHIKMTDISYEKSITLPITVPIFEKLQKSALLRNTWVRTIEVPLTLPIYGRVGEYKIEDDSLAWTKELHIPPVKYLK